jgi:membrane-associated phospholipid phosphatase
LGIAIKLAMPSLFYPVLVAILIAGFLMSARLHLNAHTPAQIIVGTILGFIVSLSVVIFFI